MAARVKVVGEDENGRNTRFSDVRTGQGMTRAQFVKAIEAGKYPDYHVRKINGTKTPAANPDGRTRNNLG